MWERLGRRSDRRAKKNTDLIKVKYALPAMWVIILDLCINPFFLPVPVGRAAPASRPPSYLAPRRPALFPHTLRIFLPTYLPSHIVGSPPRDSRPSRACIPLILRANLDSFSVYFQRHIKLVSGSRIRIQVITINSIYHWNYNETLKRSPGDTVHGSGIFLWGKILE